MSRGILLVVVETSEQPVKDALAADLALGRGVVTLPLKDWRELAGGHEKGARLADRFEMAVQLTRAGAVAIAEHAAIHLATELGHFAAFVLRRQLLGLVVER